MAAASYLIAAFIVIDECACTEQCSLLGVPLPTAQMLFCGVCNKGIHGCCGVFNGDDDAVSFNICFICDENKASMIAYNEIAATAQATEPCIAE